MIVMMMPKKNIMCWWKSSWICPYARGREALTKRKKNPNNLCCRFLTFKILRKNCNMIFRKWGGGAVKGRLELCRNLSILVWPPVSKTLEDAWQESCVMMQKTEVFSRRPLRANQLYCCQTTSWRTLQTLVTQLKTYFLRQILELWVWKSACKIEKRIKGG